MSLNGLGELMTVLGLAGLLWAEARDYPKLRAFTKTLASAGFIVAAFGFGALQTRYGQIILVGLILGALGDVLLLGRAKRYFLGGLVAFLFGHIAYIVAFASLELDQMYALVAAVALALFMFGVAKWVFPHAEGMRGPIALYMVVIATMVVLALGAWGAGAAWMIPLGALMFAVSDIAVVRDRFVKPGFVNRLWGLPLYFAAQLLIAWSILSVRA